ncbi:hypothetical protein GXW74_09545 [Roseomonas eburnea]|uniref:Lipoprotein n=1 Tax=Neoroseomonas eburnea TaxID=1346889 RepID=A0A9X9XAJ6_9PROT|nr:hypothetical protein [Neoroseomonas eburnea]MBR0680732.1 hypothetical protein [Neoroseomonas eburnea]
MMRRSCLVAAFLTGACSQSPAPQVSPAPVQALPPPVPVGTTEQRAARAVDRALRTDDGTQRREAADPDAPRQTGKPGYAPLDIGGAGQMPEMPNQVSPAFRGL